MPWIARKLRGAKVFVRADIDGAPAADSGGRVDIVYKLDSAAKVYRAAVRNLEPTGDPADDRPLPDFEPAAPQDNATNAAGTPAPEHPRDAVIIYTDGACTGNPGPAGLGAVLIDGDRRKEISEYLGEATNNIAELTAIQRALEAIKDRNRRILLHTDSSYSIGVLTKNWKAKANVELIANIRALIATFPRLELVKVKGHSGVRENERADELARLAIEQR